MGTIVEIQQKYLFEHRRYSFFAKMIFLSLLSSRVQFLLAVCSSMSECWAEGKLVALEDGKRF